MISEVMPTEQPPINGTLEELDKKRSVHEHHFRMQFKIIIKYVYIYAQHKFNLLTSKEAVTDKLHCQIINKALHLLCYAHLLLILGTASKAKQKQMKSSKMSDFRFSTAFLKR